MRSMVGMKRRRVWNKEEEDAKDDVRCMQNHVFFYAEVSSETMLDLHEALRKADAFARANQRDCIRLHINSPGGDVYPALAMMDNMADAGNGLLPIWTIAEGMVASAATLLLLGGARRFAMPHASILIHQVSTDLEGTYTELKRDTKQTASLMRLLEDVYVRHSTLKRKDIRRMVEVETVWMRKTPIEYGFVEGPPPAEGRTNVHIRWDDFEK